MLFVPCNVQVETRRYIVPSIDEAKVPKNSSSQKNFYKIEVAIMDPSAQQARRNQRCFPRFLDRIDIFNYIPVPESFPVSTRNSKIGTVIMLLLFIAYTCYDFTMFVIKNSPTITSYPVLLPDDVPSRPDCSQYRCQELHWPSYMVLPSIKHSAIAATSTSPYNNHTLSWGVTPSVLI